MTDSTGMSVQAKPQLSEEEVLVFPLSFAQERLWVLDRLEPNSAFYNLAMSRRLIGVLDVEALEKTLNAIVQRHEILRTTFLMRDEQPVQIIAATLRIDLPVTDLSDLPQEQREEEARCLANEEARRPFDLSRGPLLRASLLRLAAEEHVLVLTMHHIVSDGWSQGVLTEEIVALYQAFCQGKSSPLSELPIRYADFALWQREWLQGEVLDQQVAFWKGHLHGAPPLLEIPTDRPRPPVETFRGDAARIWVSPNTTEKLKALSRREGVTLYMTLLAAFDVLLSRYSGQEDIVVGTPIANRNRPELESLIGFFTNTLALRCDLSGNPSFCELLSRVREVALGAYTHQDLPFEKLVEALRPERSLSHNPLFQVMFALQNQPRANRDLPGLKLQPFGTKVGAAKVDLALFMREKSDGLSGTLEYNTDIFDECTIARLLDNFQTLVEAIVEDPARLLSDLPLLSFAERQQLLREWNDTQRDYPRTLCVHQLFEAQAERTPDAVALAFGEETISYRELNARANQLAQYLGKRGVGAEKLVGLYVERSLEMVVAVLGVLKAGAAYVPLDPAFPQERVAFMVEDSGLEWLLTQAPLMEQLPAHSAQVVRLDADWSAIAAEGGEIATRLEVKPRNLAYVLYTSGSTGQPKGVQIEHGNVLNFLSSMQREPGLSSEDALLAVTTLSFDIAGLELLLPLTVGARVVLATRQQASDGAQLRRLLEGGITVMQATPATWRLLLESGWTGHPQLKILCGGEALPRELAELLLPRCQQLWNMYGPTETTIWSSVYRVQEVNWALAPIGRPIGNTQMYVLDRQAQPVPMGIVGEIYIGGHGVARGYLNRSELMAEKFIADPFSSEPGHRLYRTGDLARYRADGNLVYLGRRDNQIKLRGFRIELGEIESVLSQHPGVQQSVVVVREDRPGNRQLVGYIVPERKPVAVAGEERSAEPHLVLDLKQYLRQKLPEYMVPSSLVTLDALPLTANGKVDRRALPAPEFERAAKVVAPRDEIEQKLVEIWQALLGIREVSIRDNFFELGGHSLLAVRMITEIGKATGKQIPLVALFQGATIEALATLLREDVSPQEQMVVEIQPGGAKPPLFLIVIPGMNSLGYAALARHLGEDQPVYKIQAPGARLRGRPYTTAEYDQLAAEYLHAMKTIQPEGSYYLGGMCEGARVAFDMARALEANHEEVTLLAIFDTWVVENTQIRSLWMIDYYVGRLADFWRLPFFKKREVVLKVLRNRKIKAKATFGVAAEPVMRWPEAYWPGKDFVPPTFGGKITLFKMPKQPYYYKRDPLMGWGAKTTAGVDLQVISLATKRHILIFRDPHVQQLASKLAACIERAQDSDLQPLSIPVTVGREAPEMVPAERAES